MCQRGNPSRGSYLVDLLEGQEGCGSRGGQFQTEAGALAIEQRLKGESAAQQGGPAPRQGQTQANPAGSLVRAAAAPERTEDGSFFRIRNARTAVLHLENRLVIFNPDAQPQALVIGGAAVLTGVVDQVAEDLLD